MRKKLSLLVALIIISQTAFADQNIKPKTPIPIMGGGYSDDMQIPISMTCLKPGQFEFSGDTKSIISLGKSYKFDDIQKELNVDIATDVSIGLFSFDASTDYAKYIQNTSYSESFYYLEKILLPTKVLTSLGFGPDKALNSFGRDVYGAGPDQFRLSCGNKFYQQAVLGADFFATFKLAFNSAFDKSTFNAAVGGGIGDFFSAKASIQKIVKEKNIRGALEISAYQNGGDPTQLAKIFSKCDSHYCVTSCSLSNLEPCQSTIDGIIDYAQNYLPKQIDFKDGQVYGYANPIHYEFMDYAQLGLKVGSSILTPEIIAARQYLGRLYKETLHNEEMVDHILSSQVVVSIVREYKDKLLSLSEVLHTNAALLADSNNGAMACYLHPTECVVTKQRIDSLLRPIDTSILNMFKTGYLDRSVDGPYLVTPVGGDQFQSFNDSGSHFTSQQTMKISADGKTLHVDGMDIGRNHFWGDFNKAGDGTYTGQLRYDNGRIENHQFTLVENPI